MTATTVASAAPERPCPLTDADLWILAGQSNMEGCGKHKAPCVSDPRIQLFSMEGAWREARDPLHRLFEAAAPVHRRLILEGGMITPEQFDANAVQSRVTPLNGVGSGLFFARRVLEATGRPLGLIASAHGGTSMDQWSPELLAQGGDSLYGAMFERLHQVCGERLAGRVKGVLWYQGESDVINGVADAFEAKLIAFIDTLRRDTQTPALPFFMVQLGRLASADTTLPLPWEKVREAQRRVCRQRPAVYMVPAIDLPLDDCIHIAYEGQARLGARLAELALAHVYGVTGRAQALEPVSARIERREQLDARIVLTVAGVSGRLMAVGRPNGFIIRSDAVPEGQAPQVFRVDFDAEHPDRIILSLQGPLLPERLTLVYGPGFDPYVNITDERDMALPTFETTFDFNAPGARRQEGEETVYEFTID